MTSPTVTALDVSGVLGAYRATSVTRQMIALAVEGELRPHIIDRETRRGLYRVMLNGEGTDALFGALHVSARNGNIVRASLTHGNWGTAERFEKVADIRRVLKSWAAVVRVATGSDQ